MHLIQKELLELSKKENLAKLSLRDMAGRIGIPKASPQQIKHHLLQLQKKGFFTIDRANGIVNHHVNTPSWAKGLFNGKGVHLLSIPIVGAVNCGPATIFAEQNFQGFLKVSSKLIDRAKPIGLYAIKAEGSSMNRANVKGGRIEDGDYIIIDGEDKNVTDKDVILTIIDNKATVKRFIDDRKNGQIVLKADSSFDYEPVHLHPTDDFMINGKVIGVIKRPKF